jgi:hypothetical protein|tara:strand:+ start:153 stop:317 length:165 start_codon:yes stop_codon:yes gene_type:complete
LLCFSIVGRIADRTVRYQRSSWLGNLVERIVGHTVVVERIVGDTVDVVDMVALG